MGECAMKRTICLLLALTLLCGLTACAKTAPLTRLFGLTVCTKTAPEESQIVLQPQQTAGHGALCTNQHKRMYPAGVFDGVLQSENTSQRQTAQVKRL